MSLLNIFSEGIPALGTLPSTVLGPEKRRIIQKLELLIEQIKEL
jgi:hypothetical protein